MKKGEKCEKHPKAKPYLALSLELAGEKLDIYECPICRDTEKERIKNLRK